MTQKFGGDHTVHKLDALEEYLKMFTKALSRQKFKLVYFDAFAGTGSVDLTKDTDDDSLSIPNAVQMELIEDKFNYQGVQEISAICDGSVRRALNLERKFDKYIFVEKKKVKYNELLHVINEYPKLTERINVIHGDANQALIDFCINTNWDETRAVVFLDPFGSQVEFNTIKKLAQTEAIDLWYLFPSFLSIYRQISNSGSMTPEQENSISRIMGTDSWKEEWIKPEPQLDLLENMDLTMQKQVEVDDITRYMIKQMRQVFRGGVLDVWLPLGQNNSHWYSLLFALANPSEKAKIAFKFARYVMEQK